MKQLSWKLIKKSVFGKIAHYNKTFRKWYKRRLSRQIIASQTERVAWEEFWGWQEELEEQQAIVDRQVMDEYMSQICARCGHVLDAHRHWGFGYCNDCNISYEAAVCSGYVSQEDYTEKMQQEWDQEVVDSQMMYWPDESIDDYNE